MAFALPGSVDVRRGNDANPKTMFRSLITALVFLPGTALRVLGIGGVLLWASACAQYAAVDKPLTEWTPDRSDIEYEQIQGDRDSELLVMVAFSGGGSRASSLAYGVLQELNEIVISKGSESRTLLEEIDMVSSVSGGSFTAAYFALHGDKIFADFESKFLRKNVEWRCFGNCSIRSTGHDCSANLMEDRIWLPIITTKFSLMKPL
jgi:hypothetical protein